MIINDYLVRYESVCDPYTENCYIGHEDEAGFKKYFYKEITRPANEIFLLCGKDITDCEKANSCASFSENCIVKYCDFQEESMCDSIPNKFNGE